MVWKQKIILRLMANKGVVLARIAFLITPNGLRLMAGVNQPNIFEQFRSLDIRCCYTLAGLPKINN
jgi:hypothetical protein